MAVDLERCIGCHACSVACRTDHGTGAFPHTRRGFLPALRMQCADAPCFAACPSDDGVVQIDVHNCVACGECIKACPYGAPYLHSVREIADKCDFCHHRLNQGMLPACVEVCPTDVLVVGDANDPSSPILRVCDRHRDHLTVPRAV